MRWLFHVVRTRDLRWTSDGRYAPASLADEGFVHASYRDRVDESARLYFDRADDLRVLAIDPRRLDVPVDIVETPRGPMPHVRGSIHAIDVIDTAAVARHPDEVDDT